jgi:hypothetical protein
MKTGLLPALPVWRVSAPARYWAFRAIQIAEAASPRGPWWAVVVVSAAVLAAWFVNSTAWGFAELQAMVAVCTGSLVATAALTVGWASEPEELERWVLRALAATLMSALPLVT